MKPFNLEEAKAGKTVCTKEGKSVRIVCFDYDFSDGDTDYPIIGLIRGVDREYIGLYTNDGVALYHDSDRSDKKDLMMSGVIIREAWINICDESIGGPYKTKEEADRDFAFWGLDDVSTLKIRWEEKDRENEEL